MKKKMLITLLAATVAGSFLLNGCGGIDLTSLHQDDTTLSAEMESENLTDGSISLHCNWYAVDGTALAGAKVTFKNGGKELFSGTTDEYGYLELCVIPGNSNITCTVTDTVGTILAESTVVFKISDDYADITIFPVHGEEDSEHVVAVPSAKTDMRAAMYISEDGRVSFANVSPYLETEAAPEATDAEATGEEAVVDPATQTEVADPSAEAAAQEAAAQEAAAQAAAAQEAVPAQ